MDRTRSSNLPLTRQQPRAVRPRSFSSSLEVAVQKSKGTRLKSPRYSPYDSAPSECDRVAQQNLRGRVSKIPIARRRHCDAIGPKEYLAVQSSGRHQHPVKYDNLEHSSYLFVFALN